MADPSLLLRRVTDGEFASWARMIANTYGSDRSDEELARERAAIELNRTVAALDGDTPVGGAAIYTRSLTVPGAVLPVAGVTWVGVAPTHRRRGVLTSLMRKQLSELHDSAGEPIAALRPSEAAIYGRFGYGPATRQNQFRCDKRSLHFRPGTDFGDGTIQLLDRDTARPLIEKVYDQVRAASVAWPDRAERFWDSRLADAPHSRGGATSLRCLVHRDAVGDTTGYAALAHPQIPRDHRRPLTPGKPHASPQPNLLTLHLPLRGQAPSLRIPHTIGIAQGPRTVTTRHHPEKVSNGDTQARPG
ncbi:GNAT family N-acetyltransferase [Streptomyces sp. NPDC059122]|uniref:GNAT family N-acetyltransferase n=1 Tax=Streptomyces sp. NPDC059122 TaxID=3346732 RepID=UPI0036863C87